MRLCAPARQGATGRAHSCGPRGDTVASTRGCPECPQGASSRQCHGGQERPRAGASRGAGGSWLCPKLRQGTRIRGLGVSRNLRRTAQQERGRRRSARLQAPRGAARGRAAETIRHGNPSATLPAYRLHGCPAERKRNPALLKLWCCALPLAVLLWSLAVRGD